ncbi:MAG: shikimate dehydrogenase [Syntrophomonadaceae bacterium]|nr:shikimate dehydrogenase [Syntrophomonadaceae bacterium]
MRIDQGTRVYGLIGYPLDHSLSPFIHNLAFEAMGINAVYLPFPVKPGRLSAVVEGARALGIRGFNVTIPHKETIIPFLDGISPEAEACGSVNTVLIEEDRAVGHNTDGIGFMDSLEQEGVEVPRMAIILGAGGAARAIGHQLALRGTVTVFLNRTPERAEKLACDITRITGQESFGVSWDSDRISDFVQDAELLINTTPVGMYPGIDQRPPFVLKNLNPKSVVADIIYNPPKTRLLREAEALGLKTVSGLGMFVNQGVRSWEMFTGREAPRKLMEDELRGLLLKNET